MCECYLIWQEQFLKCDEGYWPWDEEVTQGYLCGPIQSPSPWSTAPSLTSYRPEMEKGGGIWSIRLVVAGKEQKVRTASRSGEGPHLTVNDPNEQEMDLPLGPPEGNTVLPTPWLCSMRPLLDFWLTELKDNKLALFKPLFIIICYDNNRKLIPFLYPTHQRDRRLFHQWVIFCYRNSAFSCAHWNFLSFTHGFTHALWCV